MRIAKYFCCRLSCPCPCRSRKPNGVLPAHTSANIQLAIISTVSHPRLPFVGRPRFSGAQHLYDFTIATLWRQAVTVMPPLLSRICCAFCWQRQCFCCYYCYCWLAFVTVRRNIVGVGSHIFALVAAVFLHGLLVWLARCRTDSRRVTHNNNMYSCATSANAAADNDCGKAWNVGRVQTVQRVKEKPLRLGKIKNVYIEK